MYDRYQQKSYNSQYTEEARYQLTQYNVPTMAALQSKLDCDFKYMVACSPKPLISYKNNDEYQTVMRTLVDVTNLSEHADVQDAEEVTEYCRMRYRKFYGGTQRYNMFLSKLPKTMTEYTKNVYVFIVSLYGDWIKRVQINAKVADGVWIYDFPLTEFISTESETQIHYPVRSSYDTSKPEYQCTVGRGYQVFIQPQPNTITIRRMNNALSKFRVGSSCSLTLTKQILSGGIGEQFGDCSVEAYGDYWGRRVSPSRIQFPPELKDRLNASQIDAVNSALQNSATVIQGPPGTGKTTTCAAIVKAWSMSPQTSQILVCAGSNTAADNLCLAMEKLELMPLRVFCYTIEKGIILPRRFDVIQDNYRVNTDVIDKFEVNHRVISYMKSKQYMQTLDQRTQQVVLSHLEKLQNPPKTNVDEKGQMTYPEQLYDGVYQTFMQNSKIIVCTCSTAGGQNFDGKTFECVLLDESSQCVEPEQLIPITRGCERLVLAGDTRQLGPVIKVQQMERRGYGTTLMERMIQNGVPCVQLDEQYRMHPTLLEVPNRLFYGGAIRCGQNVRAGHELAPRPGGEPLLQPGHMCLFVDVAGKEAKNELTQSYSNQLEASVALQLVDRVRAAYHIAYSDIGVITFYSEQRRLLHKTFKAAGLREVEINSVDGFQGREKKVIVISSVRTDGVGFVDDERRLNVALTRAQYQLYVIGNSAALCSGPMFGRVIERYRQLGVLVKATDLFQGGLTGQRALAQKTAAGQKKVTLVFADGPAGGQ